MFVCDVNRDQKIDILDIDLILAALQAGTGALDPRDLDSDGLITINDANGCKLRCDYLNCVPLPRAMVGTSYTASLTPRSANMPYTFSVTAGSLPGGITLNTSTGTLSGSNPAVDGTFPITVTITENDPPARTFSSDYTLFVDPAPVTALAFATGSTLPNATKNTLYKDTGNSVTISASGGKAPYIFMRTTGSLPSGLTISSAGLISGTPTNAAVTSTFNIRVADSAGSFVTQAFTITVQ
jgi:hypothetical protein